MIIFETKIFVYKPKAFLILNLKWSFHLQNSCVFSGFHHRLHMPSNTFWTLTIGVFEQVQVFHPKECLALFTITRHKFFFFHFMQLYDFVRLRPTVPSPPIKHQMRCWISIIHSHPCNVMFPCICNAMCHMSISCHISNECHMDNINHTFHHVSWTIILHAYNLQNKHPSQMSIY